MCMKNEPTTVALKSADSVPWNGADSARAKGERSKIQERKLQSQRDRQRLRVLGESVEARGAP